MPVDQNTVIMAFLSIVLKRLRHIETLIEALDADDDEVENDPWIEDNIRGLAEEFDDEGLADIAARVRDLLDE